MPLGSWLLSDLGLSTYESASHGWISTLVEDN